MFYPSRVTQFVINGSRGDGKDSYSLRVSFRPQPEPTPAGVRRLPAAFLNGEVDARVRVILAPHGGFLRRAAHVIQRANLSADGVNVQVRQRLSPSLLFPRRTRVCRAASRA